jgi:outer membrane protein OmpA-like peptidoglycan-associated protein
MVNDMYSSATIGITYKFGYHCPEVIEPVAFIPPAALVLTEPAIKFMVVAPRAIPVGRSVREVFPIRNYVFFDLGSTQIPDRYVLITKNQVKDFREDQVEMFTPKNKSGRSERQMIVYYNILNILGDRMIKNPSVAIKLVGSTELGPEDGRLMAETVKTYLVDVFGIASSRITTEGRLNPKIPSEQPGGTSELDLLRAGDRRVSIESTSPVLLMEFQSGPYAPLKPIEILSMDEAPFESNVFLTVAGSKQAFISWSIEVIDNNGAVQNFGPYTAERVNIPGKQILGSRPEGKYKVIMTGQAKNGMIVKRDTTVNMVLWTPPKNEEVMRFSVIYEFDDSKAIKIYERYLTDVVMLKIPAGGTVILHGYTDIIGDEDYNQKLALARANDVRTILENGLAKSGRTDVKFEVYAFGEDEKLSPFDNRYPEERFYNRTVIIDVVPKK